MSYQACKEYLAVIVDGYKKVSKSEKTKILNEAVKITGLSRKHIVRLLKQPKESLIKRKASGRPEKYSRSQLVSHIHFLWTQMERISGRRMKAAFSDWLPFYKNDFFTQEIRLSLEKMSSSTLERFLKEIRKNNKISKGLSTTSPARYMKNKIPINTLDAKIEKPGFMQSDTVAHCGDSAGGSFISSVTLTDIHSGWTENFAMPNKKGHEVRKAFTELESSLPFTIIAINTDSGSEFLNTPVLNFTRRPDGSERIVFTRSRPYKKNDNCYVEQKNFTHVRELFGYERFEDQKLVSLMNKIYKEYWNPLQNFFIPTFKLKEKTRIGAKLIKKFDAPITPYDRLMQSSHLSVEEKENLKKTKNKLNPFLLKTELEKHLKIFFEELRKSKSKEAA